jgi:hypothetical protein
MSDVLNPIRRPRIAGAEIEVRELRWRDTSYAVQQLTDAIAGMIDIQGTAFNLIIDRQKLLDAIIKNESLLAFVLEKATGRDADWVTNLSTRDMLLLLDAVLDVNLSEEVLNAGKKVAERLKKLFGSMKPSPGSPIGSSTAVTA